MVYCPSSVQGRGLAAGAVSGRRQAASASSGAQKTNTCGRCRLGIIDCLSAGYRFLSWRLELILIPVVLDLLLWLGPQFSMAPLFEQAAAFYAEMASADSVTPEMGQMVEQLAGGIRELGASTNLLGGVVSGSLLHVPSLLVATSPPATSWLIVIGTPGEALVWWLLFSLLGLLIGVIYLSLLARRLPIGGMAGARAGRFAVSVLRHWLQVIGLVAVAVITMLLVYLPVSLAVGLVMLISPAAGSAIAAAAGVMTIVVYLFFYFVVPGLVMDDLALTTAIGRSVRLVQEHFLATIGFFLLTVFISWGFTLLLAALSQLTPWGALVAIIVNAYIGTGLAMALLVFYRSRIVLKEQQEQRK